MVVPEVEIEVVCEEGITIGAFVVSFAGELDASVTAVFLRIMCGDTCMELLDETPLLKRFITSTLVFDDISLLYVYFFVLEIFPTILSCWLLIVFDEVFL
jgi:hypothetical protein